MNPGEGEYRKEGKHEVQTILAQWFLCIVKLNNAGEQAGVIVVYPIRVKAL